MDFINIEYFVLFQSTKFLPVVKKQYKSKS